MILIYIFYVLHYCILLKAQYLLSIQITSAALNTKTDFQVAVTPAEMCKHFTIERVQVERQKILSSQVKITSQNLFK